MGGRQMLFSRAAVWASRLLTAAALVVLVGMLPFLSGQDPASAVLRARSAEQVMTPEALAAVREQLGLGETAWETFALWLGDLLRGDLGTSWVSGAHVGPSVLEALGTSAVLMVCALALGAVVAAALCAPAVRRGMRGQPRLGSGAAGAVLTAMPEFLLGSVLLIVLAVQLDLLPPYGWGEPVDVVLPALSLGLPAGGLLGRLLAEAITAAYREPWVGTWVMAGATRGQVLIAVLRRALPGLLPQIGLIMVGLTGGAVAVEQIFTVPGLGRTALGAAQSSDLPMLQASVLVLLLIGVLAGAGSAALGRRMLHGSLEASALTTTGERTRARRGWWVLPLMCSGLLAVLMLASVPLDAYAAMHERLAPPGSPSPGGTAWLGADASGRDVLARVGAGAVSTITAALACTLACWVIGLLAGLVPALATGPAEAANAVPPVLAGIVIAAIWGPSGWGAVLAVVLISWAPLAAHAASLREQTEATAYGTTAALLGVPRWRFLLRTVLPEVAGPTLRHAMLRIPGIALALAALGFLGLGPQPPAADWGLQLADGITYAERAPWVAGAPLLALMALSVAAVALSSRRT